MGIGLNVSVVRGTITTNRTEFPYGSEVTSKPTGLVVSTNGVEIGKTPITLQELKPAFYNLTVSDGENDLMAQIHVGPKENAKHDFAFRYGMVQLTTTPPGATVVRKGREVGKTPVTLEHIPAGESAIELRLAGYVFTNFAFVGVADTTTSYTVSLVSEQYLADLSEARRAAAGSQPDYSVALAKIAEALKIYPDNADALQLQKDYQFGQTLNEASALLAKGDLDQASTKIEVALALKPSDEKAIAVKQQIAGAKAQRDRVAKEEAARQAIEQAKEAARQSDEKANEAGQMFQQHIANVTDLVTRNPFSMGGKPFAFRTQTWRVHQARRRPKLPCWMPANSVVLSGRWSQRRNRFQAQPNIICDKKYCLDRLLKNWKCKYASFPTRMLTSAQILSWLLCRITIPITRHKCVNLAPAILPLSFRILVMRCNQILWHKHDRLILRLPTNSVVLLHSQGSMIIIKRPFALPDGVEARQSRPLA